MYPALFSVSLGGGKIERGLLVLVEHDQETFEMDNVPSKRNEMMSTVSHTLAETQTIGEISEHSLRR